MRILTLGFLLIISAAAAQEIDNMNVVLSTDSMGVTRYLITYDLIATHSNIPCSVRVKFTGGARQFYLKQVTGDVGNLVYPGKGKRIAWDHLEELVNYKGENVNLMVEASPNINTSSKVKRGRKLSIKLDDIYSKGKTYAMKLYRHDKEVVRLNDMMVLENSFVVDIPTKIGTGKDYQFSITDGEKTYYSNTFKIKPKVGTFWKLSPLLLVPIYLIIKKNVDDNQPLPEAPEIN